MSFDPNDYVDVAERIGQFTAKFPEGSLQSELTQVNDASGNLVGWLCVASAYRDANDPRPGIGHAYEPVPGKTAFTRDSEAMNAETSAWGRAIIALGFPTKKIASADEVKARVPGPERGFAPGPKQPSAIEKAQAAQQANRKVPDDNGEAEELVLSFGKHKGSKLTEVPQNYVEWLASDKFQPKFDDQRRAKTAAELLMGFAPDLLAAEVDPDDDIPF